MFSYYLFNKSYEKASVSSIEKNLQDLNDIFVDEKKEGDIFLMHDSIWEIETERGDFAIVVYQELEDRQFAQQVLPKLLGSIESIEEEIKSLPEFDERYNTYNAFYGISFLEEDLERCISDKASYLAFRQKQLLNVTPKTFWERREKLFQRIILCAEVQGQIETIGGTYLSQIIVQLRELDKYAIEHWNSGRFDYRDAMRKSTLDITPESKTTMQQEKYRNQRMFKLPNGRIECFELHVKAGDLRIHIFPENFTIYVGYIGKHLGITRN